MQYPTDNIRLQQYRQIISATNTLQLWKELTDMEECVRKIHPFHVEGEFSLYIDGSSIYLSTSQFKDESFFYHHLDSATGCDQDRIRIDTPMASTFMNIPLRVRATTYISIPEEYKLLLRKMSVIRTIYPDSYETLVCSSGD